MVKYEAQGEGLFDTLGDALKVAGPVAKPLLTQALASNPETAPLAPFVSLIPIGGGLGDKYHKVHQFNPYEWEHIREAAKQKIRGGKASNYWEAFGAPGMGAGIPKEAYLDVVRCHAPHIAGRIIAQAKPEAAKFGAALTDSIKAASHWVARKADRIEQHSKKARQLIDEHLPRLIALGKRAQKIAKNVENISGVVKDTLGPAAPNPQPE